MVVVVVTWGVHMHPTPPLPMGLKPAASSLLLWARAGTDRQTDGQTEGQTDTVLLHRQTGSRNMVENQHT